MRKKKNVKNVDGLNKIYGKERKKERWKWEKRDDKFLEKKFLKRMRF